MPQWGRQLDHPVFKAVSEAAEELGITTFVVGGFVRDLLLDRPSNDIDFVTIGDGPALAKASAKKLGNPKVSIFKHFGTAHFDFGGLDVEFVGARKESYLENSRKPEVTTGTLEDDQNRRDFTINAMAISVNAADFGTLIDPFDGQKDLAEGIIRTPLDPVITYSDDPLRMMRAIRFASQLGFKIERKSFSAIRKNAYRLDIISAERITEELNKIILSKKPSRGFKLLDQAELLDRFFPELTALKGVDEKMGMKHKDNFIHTLQVLDNVSSKSDDLWLRWAALLHDIAKPETKRFFPDLGWTFHGHEDRGARLVPKLFKRLRLPLDHKMKFVQKMVSLHLRPIALTKEEISDSAIRRLLFDAGDDLEELMILCKADITSKNEAKVRKYLQNYKRVQEKLIEVEEKDRVRNWQPPISGEEIMETFEITPGPVVGNLKNAIKEAILDGIIPNHYDEARAFMFREAEKLGLKPSVDSKPGPHAE